MQTTKIRPERLLRDIEALGSIGRDAEGQLTRLAATEADKAGRDAFAKWAREAGLDVNVDRIGNMFAIWYAQHESLSEPLMIGSHIDTVVNAGMLDGCYGVLAGLEVVRTLKEAGLQPKRPVVVAAFTNEEGVRFAPDMMGSAVFAGLLDLKAALASTDGEGMTLGAELDRIGYSGPMEPGFIRPHAYVELHIEQGPVLEREGIAIGVVESLQGISWQRLTITGEANHAGTTPMGMRRDAGHAASRIVCFLHDLASASEKPMVATVGRLKLVPDAINVIPGSATLTVDMRSPDDARLASAEMALSSFLKEIADESGLDISVERLARTPSVRFDGRIADRIAEVAGQLGLSSRRMTSGAGHDAQMISPIAPTAMIFVPSIGGISHNPREASREADLVAGANVLLEVVRKTVI